MEIIYEDNHLIVVNKAAGEIVQGDKTGDEPLLERVRAYIKETYAKPGNVFCGLVHRLDRPVAGLVVFAKTSKALSRMCELFRKGEVSKTYWAITRNLPAEPQARLTHWITTVERTNKSTAHQAPCPGAKESRLSYRVIGRSERYNLLEVKLETGRKHQIRVQLSAIGCPVKGDLKYGDKRSNPDGGISLMARKIEFIHPVSRQPISLIAPVPDGDPLWLALEQSAAENSNR
ncbi:MAG: RluA family pseudouridine synthase [Muribaculaceae bacterium]|nr:RluA family pseudouridine synthase [Muribaculaceae bacterium]